MGVCLCVEGTLPWGCNGTHFWQIKRPVRTVLLPPQMRSTVESLRVGVWGRRIGVVSFCFQKVAPGRTLFCRTALLVQLVAQRVSIYQLQGGVRGDTATTVPTIVHFGLAIGEPRSGSEAVLVFFLPFPGVYQAAPSTTYSLSSPWLVFV